MPVIKLFLSHRLVMFHFYGHVHYNLPIQNMCQIKGNLMLWIKALHIIAVVCWFAGLFYLPRLFVYHAEMGQQDALGYQRFCAMERKLFWYITTPSAIFVILFGFWMIHFFGFDAIRLTNWLGIKIALVALLIIYHIYCGILVSRFKNNKNPHGGIFYRWFNEFPTVMLFIIVFLTVLKPL